MSHAIPAAFYGMAIGFSFIGWGPVAILALVCGLVTHFIITFDYVGW